MIGRRFCPNCGSEDIALVAGGTTGSFMCKKCGFAGSLFPEMEIILNKEVKNDD